MNRLDRGVRRPALLAVAVSLACGGWAAAAAGQQRPAQVGQEGARATSSTDGERTRVSPARLDEVIVTARRRTESLFDVPVAVSAFSSELIGELNLENINDIARYTPGFSFNSAFGRQEDRPVIRGVGSILNGIAGIGSAATFVDGVFVGGSVTSTELLNVERVEIIKGPQAAQFGRGTYAGAINYVTRRPSNEFEGEVQVGVAQHRTLEGSAWLSGPIVEDRLYYYVAGGWDEYGGEYTNTETGRKVGDTQTRSFSGRLLFTPSDDVDVSLRLGYNRQDDGHPALWMQGRDQNNCCFRGPDRPRAREYYIGTAQVGNDVTLATDLFDDLGGAGLFRERWLGSLTIDWRLPNNMSFQSITGIVDDENGSNLDVSYTANDVLFNPGLPPFLQPILAGNFFSSREFSQEDFSQEFRLSSSQEQALRWTAGVYYYEGERRDTRFDKVIPANTGVIGNPENIVTNVAPFRFEDIENRAVFGGVEWDASERLTLSLEARYAEDDVTLANRDAATGAEVNRFNDTFKSFTPRATALYRLTEDWNLYANVARGTRPGTFNPQVPAGPDGEPDESLRAVDEEVSLTYELGTRANILDGRGSVVAAGYFTTLRDQQTSRIIVLPTGQTAAAPQLMTPNQIRGQLSAGYLFVVNLTGIGFVPTATALVTDFVFGDDAKVGWSMALVAV